AVEIVNQLDTDDAIAVIGMLSHDDGVRLLDQPELERAPEILTTLSPNIASHLLDGMSADRATDVFQEMDDDERARLFPILAPETKAALKKLMGYPPNTAGSLMTIEFIAVTSDWNVGQTLEYIRKVERTRETVYAIYVLDPKTRILLGVVSLRRLIIRDPSEPILSIARDDDPITITPLTSREELARLFRKHDLLAVP